MNENIDLTKILKDCPKGTMFYTSVWGDVYFNKIIKTENKGCAIALDTCQSYKLITKEGRCSDNYGAECIIFPSKDQRDWSKFTAPWYKKEKFDPKTLKPFDKVIARCSDFNWVCDMFSHYDKSKCVMPYVCVGGFYEVCIPYNDETNHLVGTTDEAPEYYRYWEE